MYFESRASAGAQLAADLIGKYRYENTAVLALSDGGVAVGYQVAIYLHAALHSLPMGEVTVNGGFTDYCTVMPGGVVAVNPHVSAGSQEYYMKEYLGLIDYQLRGRIAQTNKEAGTRDITPEIFRDYNVIVVDDCIHDDIAIDAARVWLKPARIKRFILAAPLISVKALDTAHIIFDELHILSVVPNMLDTQHYYDVADEPNQQMQQAMIRDSMLHWK